MVLDAKSFKSSKSTTSIKSAARGFTLPKAFIRENGTGESTSFNEANWGIVTRGYMDVIKNRLRPSSFEKVIKKAKDLTTVGQGGRSRSTADNAMDMDELDTYAQVVDLSDDECK